MAAIMGLVAVLLVAAFAVICAISHSQSVEAAYDAMNAAIDGGLSPNAVMRVDGEAPRGDGAASGGEAILGDGEAPHADGEAGEAPRPPEPIDANGASAGGAGAPMEIGGKPDAGRLVPVAVYRVAPDGTLSAASDSMTAFISEDVLAQAVEQVAGLPEGKGSVDSLGLLYVKRAARGETLVAFADSASAAGWQDLALVLGAVGACAILVFFAMSLLFSKWALRPVEESWESQKRFVADASHELKTPLAVMAANTAILAKNPEKTVASQSRWVESTEIEIANMRELVDDMLFMASIEEGRAAQDFEDVDLSKLVEAQILQFESLAFERRVELVPDIDEGISVAGSAPRLDRLVRTLLDNAVKYAGEGGCVRVGLRRSGGGGVGAAPVLSVANSGEAIPEEDIPHLFERFYRVDASRGRGGSGTGAGAPGGSGAGAGAPGGSGAPTPAPGGYGLGLAIAREVAEEHGATMKVSSSPEDGTTFTVEWGR